MVLIFYFLPPLAGSVSWFDVCGM